MASDDHDDDDTPSVRRLHRRWTKAELAHINRRLQAVEGDRDMKWNWLRLTAALGSAACTVAAFLVPPAAVGLLPVGAYLLGVATKTPGYVPKSTEETTDPDAPSRR